MRQKGASEISSREAVLTFTNVQQIVERERSGEIFAYVPRPHGRDRARFVFFALIAKLMLVYHARLSLNLCLWHLLEIRINFIRGLYYRFHS